MWGAIVGLCYGMITMFPEWLFYIPNNSAISIGAFLNLPIMLLIPPQGFGFSDVADHYLVLGIVLAIDTIIFGCLFYVISSSRAQRKQ